MAAAVERPKQFSLKKEDYTLLEEIGQGVSAKARLLLGRGPGAGAGERATGLGLSTTDSPGRLRRGGLRWPARTTPVARVRGPLWGVKRITPQPLSS